MSHRKMTKATMKDSVTCRISADVSSPGRARLRLVTMVLEVEVASIVNGMAN